MQFQHATSQLTLYSNLGCYIKCYVLMNNGIMHINYNHPPYTSGKICKLYIDIYIQVLGFKLHGGYELTYST